MNQRLQVKSQVQWALIFGDCVHSGLEMYYRSNQNETDMIDGFKVRWAAENDYLKRLYGSLYGMGIEQEWHDYRDTGTQMLTYYAKYDKQSRWFDEVIDVNIEERSWVDVLSPSSTKIRDLPWVLSGKIDLVVRKKNDIWIWDHKTAAAPPMLRALEVDDQITAYCYIYWRLTGVVPRGAMYNVLLKDPPKPPRVLKDGSVSRDKSQRTTYDLYIETLNELGLDHEPYDEILSMLQEKSWRQFFIRDGSHRHLEELQSFERRLFHEFADMEKAKGNPDELYPNPGQYVCMTCPYIPLCQTMEEQGDTEFIRKEMYEAIPPRTVMPAEVASSDWKGV